MIRIFDRPGGPEVHVDTERLRWRFRYNDGAPEPTWWPIGRPLDDFINIELVPFWPFELTVLPEWQRMPQGL